MSNCQVLIWVLNAMMMLLLVSFTQPPTLKWPDINQNLVCADLPHSFQINLHPPPEGESVSRVRKDGGKSGGGKQRLPVEIQFNLTDVRILILNDTTQPTAQCTLHNDHKIIIIIGLCPFIVFGA